MSEQIAIVHEKLEESGYHYVSAMNRKQENVDGVRGLQSAD